MNLYLVRHGETQANVNHLFNGINNKDLTDYGINQAQSLINEIKNLNINLIFSSPLKRAMHTANILNINNLNIIIEKRLIERDYGNFTLKPITLIPDKSQLYDLYENKINEIESYKSIYDRVSSFIEELKENYCDKNILIVTHGDIIIAFQEYLQQRNINQPRACMLIHYKL